MRFINKSVRFRIKKNEKLKKLRSFNLKESIKRLRNGTYRPSNFFKKT